MVAFDDAEVTTQGNAIFRAGCDMFSMPGGSLFCVYTRARTFNISTVVETASEATAVKIHPFVAEPFEVNTASEATGIRIQNFGSRIYIFDAYLQANGVVRFYFFPTDFSMSVADEPLADTFFSRTRETGVNI